MMTKKLPQETLAAWRQLHRAHRRLMEQAEQALKQAELPPLAWYDLLLELQREKRYGLRQYEIGEKILLSKHNLSRLIDRLEKNRLVERHVCEEDGRGNRIVITAKGEKTLKQMWPVYNRSIQANFAAKLTREECVALGRILDKVLVQDGP